MKVGREITTLKNHLGLKTLTLTKDTSFYMTASFKKQESYNVSPVVSWRVHPPPSFWQMQKSSLHLGKNVSQ